MHEPCVPIRRHTEVTGNSAPITLCLFLSSALMFPLLSSIHPSSRSYPEQQLHIAASSPPPIPNTKMTFTRLYVPEDGGKDRSRVSLWAMEDNMISISGNFWCWFYRPSKKQVVSHPWKIQVGKLQVLDLDRNQLHPRNLPRDEKEIASSSTPATTNQHMLTCFATATLRLPATFSNTCLLHHYRLSLHQRDTSQLNDSCIVCH
ncbi:unnamed protein product [Pleuronectes platessa]|uniref:Uncharacterized protein n=1 Tax=Pleuronectes platessa TaxID=8262 RepID=A0A9N7YCL2_PLEPL|nr:unnamed protein product [Pleuronectes platessa]